MKKQTILDLFPDRIEVEATPTRPDLGPCWVWIGARTRQGYGEVYYEGRAWTASRLSLRLDGRLPDDLYALHRCDNRPCVRPDHLEPGTREDNMRHARERGRVDLTRRASREVITDHLCIDCVFNPRLQAVHAAGRQVTIVTR